MGELRPYLSPDLIKPGVESGTVLINYGFQIFNYEPGLSETLLIRNLKFVITLMVAKTSSGPIPPSFLIR